MQMDYNEFHNFMAFNAGLNSDRSIVEAIIDLAETEEDIFRIWEDPTPEEEAYVLKHGWESREYEDDEYINWGEGRINADGFID